MTQEETWQERMDRMGWKNGLSPNYCLNNANGKTLIDMTLEELIPKDELTEEQFNKAKSIWETERSVIKTVQYLQCVKYGDSSKLAKGYFDLYIDDRNYD